MSTLLHQQTRGEQIVAESPAHLLTPAEAAKYTGVSLNWLAILRVQGGGAKYLKLGRRLVRYRKQDLDAWLASHLRASTSDAGR